jgi:uncharacterized protein (DUF983 family)
LDWIFGKKNRKGENGASTVAVPVNKPTSGSGYPAESFEKFAQQASQSSASITIKMSDFSRLFDAVFDALIIAYPNLTQVEVFRLANGGFSFRCPNCGPLSNQVGSYLCLATDTFNRGVSVVFGGPNVAALAQGRCPNCGGNMLIATFSPQKIKAQLEVEKAEATAADGVSQLMICPFCKKEVVPNSDGTCPSCLIDISPFYRHKAT